MTCLILFNCILVDDDSDDQDEPMESSDDEQVLRRLTSKKELSKSIEPEIVFQEEMSPFESDESDESDNY